MARTVMIVLSLVLFLWTSHALAGNTGAQPQLIAQSVAQSKTQTSQNPNFQQLALKGELLAREIAQTTGIAMNPLLCISALGAYGYYTTDADKRASLPWHTSPKFWGSLAFVLGLIFLKDSSKIAIPKLLLIPLDAIELLIEKNGSALIALPVLFSLIHNGEYQQMELVSAQILNFIIPSAIAGNSLEMAINNGGDMITMGITTITVFMVFMVVWVCSQAFNVLIMLCPFSSVDLLLVAVKNSTVAIVITLSNNYAGFALSALIILVSIFLFPRTLRLVFFGTVMSYDIVRFRLFNGTTRTPREGLGIRCFSSCFIGQLPPLTYGTIQQDNGVMAFSYRPYYFLATKTIQVDIKPEQCELAAGLLSPIINQRVTDDTVKIQLFRIRAGYWRHQEEIAEMLGVTVNRETSLAGKFRDGIVWFSSLFIKTPTLGLYSSTG